MGGRGRREEMTSDERVERVKQHRSGGGGGERGVQNI